MSDPTDSANTTPSEVYSTREYLRIVFLNPISILGVILTFLGAVLVSRSPEHGVLPGTLLLLGVIVSAFGFTRTQHRLKRTE